ncbi:MAG: single-stranded-DNA-specific exonuclease RecJ [Deltaproteobacteria bacterium]|nr:single-stranded-DNA-specific exonuclease RecJ [Deltaproteobacteria bacterium]
MQREWIIKEHNVQAAAKLAETLGIHSITANLLIDRGIDSSEEAEKFLYPKLSDLPDPDSFPDMQRAVSRIAKAIKEKENIAIFGDYDVDGITGSALLKSFFNEIEVDPIVILPNRFEGYGLSEKNIRVLKEKSVDLLITVDNGIRANEAIDLANDLGMEVVLTDHHELGKTLPNAHSIINPHRLPKDSLYRDLSGCGVAFILLIALRKYLREDKTFDLKEPNLKQHLDLVALGTIADIVPLIGVNRTLAKFGIAEIANSSKPGIQELMSVCGTKPSEVTPTTIAFRLAPRINAAGRIGNPNLALELMLAKNHEEARVIASELDMANRKRQNIEQRIMKEATDQIQCDLSIDEKYGLVLDAKDWHLGVIGITAAKVSERNFKPTVIISRDSDPARGSARSLEGLNLMDALSRCSDLLQGYGGHAMAAGITIAHDKIDDFHRRFNEACSELILTKVTKKIEVDALISIDEINNQLIDEISILEPFGEGNPEPKFAVMDATIFDHRIVGDNHLKLSVGDSSRRFDTIGFNMGNAVEQSTQNVSLVFIPQYNTWNGNTSIQLKIKDIKPCSE